MLVPYPDRRTLNFKLRLVVNALSNPYRVYSRDELRALRQQQLALNLLIDLAPPPAGDPGFHEREELTMCLSNGLSRSRDLEVAVQIETARAKSVGSPVFVPAPPAPMADLVASASDQAFDADHASVVTDVSATKDEKSTATPELQSFALLGNLHNALDDGTCRYCYEPVTVAMRNAPCPTRVAMLEAISFAPDPD